MGGTPITVAPQSIDVNMANPGAADVLSTPQGTELLAPSTLPQFDPLAGRNQPREQMPTYNADPLSMELQAAAVHHSRGANALDAISKAIVGDTAMHITQNPDGSYTAAPQETTPGQRWGRIAAIALAGAAKGFAAGQGPGGMGRAAGAGLDTGYQAQQAQQDNTLKLAETMNKQDRDRLMTNANLAMMNQQLITATFNNKKNEVLFPQEVLKNNLQNIETLHNMGATFTGNMDSLADMYSLGQNPDNMQAHTGQNGMFIPVQTFNGDRSMKGASGWILPEDKRKQLITKPVDIPTQIPDPDNPGKLKAGTPIHYDAGAATGEDVITAMHDEMIRENNYVTTGWAAQTQAREAAVQERRATVEEKKMPAEIGLLGAQAGEAAAGGRLKDVQAELAPQALEVKAGQQSQQNFRQHDRLYVQPAETAEQAYTAANNAYKEYQAAKARGETLKTGADAMMLLAQHMGTTFGSTKGTRQTQAMIEQHVGARGITDRMQVAWNHALNGEELSADQWHDFMSLIAQARRNKWATAAREGARYGLTPDYLPNDIRQGILDEVAQRQGGAGTPGPPAPGAASAAAGTGAAYNPQTQYSPTATYQVQSGGKTFPVLGSNLARAYQLDNNIRIMGAQ